MMQNEQYNFGEHLTIDGYGGDFTKLNDKDIVLNCLHELPEMLNMRKLAQPEVYFAQGGAPKDPGGWSGFVVIAESHISVHTFPKRGFVSIDAYTCKSGMDQEFIANYFIEKFGLSDVETNFLQRGTKYPVTDIY